MTTRPRHRRRAPGVRAYRRQLARGRAARAAYAREHYAVPPGHLTTAAAFILYNHLAPEYNLPPLANERSFAARCCQVPAITPHRRPRYYGGNCYTEEHVRTLLESTADGHARRQLRWGRTLPSTHRRADARHMPAAAALEFYNSLAPAAGVRTLSDPLYLTRLLLRFDLAPVRIVGHSFYWTRATIRTAISLSAAAVRCRGRSISRAHRRRREARQAAAREARQAQRAEAAARRRELREEKQAAAALRREQEKKRAAALAAQRAEAAAARRKQAETRAAARAAKQAAARNRRRREREEKQAAGRRYPIASAALLASGKLLTPSQFAAIARCSVTTVRQLAEEGTILAYHHPQRLRPILIHAPHAAAVLLERANQNHQP